MFNITSRWSVTFGSIAKRHGRGLYFLCKNTLFLLFSANPMPFLLLFISFSLCFMLKTTSGYPFDAHFLSVNYRQLAVNFIVNMFFLFLKQDLLVIQTSTPASLRYKFSY
jgi:hypothetical protein